MSLASLYSRPIDEFTQGSQHGSHHPTHEDVEYASHLAQIQT